MSLTFLQETRKEYFYFEEQRPRKQLLESNTIKKFWGRNSPFASVLCLANTEQHTA